MGLWMKHLPCKPEGQGLNLSTHTNDRGSQTKLPARLVEQNSGFRERYHLRTVKSGRGRHPVPTSASGLRTHAHMRAYAVTHMCTVRHQHTHACTTHIYAKVKGERKRGKNLKSSVVRVRVGRLWWEGGLRDGREEYRGSERPWPPASYQSSVTRPGF